MIYKETFKTGLKDIGKDNKIKNRGILEYLENTGAYHSDLAGYGANDRKNTGVSWILLGWKLQVINRPKYGQTLTVNTWGRRMYKFYTYRDFEIFDNEGNKCAIATSKWCLVDIKTRKLSRLTNDIIQKYEPEEKNVFSEEELDKLKLPENFSLEFKYKVIRKDIDINKHLHNLYYLDLAYEALPEEVYEKRPFDNVQIMYKKEIKLGDTVNCKYANVEGKNIIVIESENGETMHAIIQLF